MSQNIVPDDEVRFSHTCQVAGCFLPKEPHHSRYALFYGCLSNIAGRLDSENRNAFGTEELKEVPVVACNFNNSAALVQSQPCGNGLGIGSGVVQPCVGKRRKIGVIRKDLFGIELCFQLDKKTLRTHVSMQWIQSLLVCQLIGFQIRVGQGTHPEIDKRMAQWRAAASATAHHAINHPSFIRSGELPIESQTGVRLNSVYLLLSRRTDRQCDPSGEGVAVV